MFYCNKSSSFTCIEFIFSGLYPSFHLFGSVFSCIDFKKKVFKDFIYLLMRDTEREAETQQREKQAPCRDPDVGLDPGSPGSGPDLG